MTKESENITGPVMPAGKWRRWVLGGLLAAGAAVVLLATATVLSVKPVPSLRSVAGKVVRARLLDRNGRPLTVSFAHAWNRYDAAALHQMPPLLVRAFLISEDKRFFHHGGVDWTARIHAAWQNLCALAVRRGASTISEQVVRMNHPRPRTLWSRWLEGFEANRLEAQNPKADILEFYLNQVPFAGRRRGVVQAAGLYFDRDLSTLNEREMLALAVMVRAPGRFDPIRHPRTVDLRIDDLAGRLMAEGFISREQKRRIHAQTLFPRSGGGPVEARHFARYVMDKAAGRGGVIHTTLDSGLQAAAQKILDQRLDALDGGRVDNAALVAADHDSGEILAWVVGRAGAGDRASVDYDAVRCARQPGSTLKPFLYAMALERGWSAATAIDDTPLSESVGHGLHAYNNYSRRHYGPVSLREALGNSLNIPAVKTLQFVGTGDFLARLYDLGMESLDRHPDFYGDGLALGNGAATLLELVQAYGTLARGGVFRPLKAVRNDFPAGPGRRVFDPPVADLIGNILSDPDARRLEFGTGGLLDLPVQTAVKTGTSNDYRDAWALGYNARHVVGVWMGNLRGRSMEKITGATGPALVLRSVFAELCRHHRPEPLSMSPRLIRRTICAGTGRPARGGCRRREEWFVDGQWPEDGPNTAPEEKLRIQKPHSGLRLAMDPRIPDHREAFEFLLNIQEGIHRVDWFLDGKMLGSTRNAQYTWPLRPGRHRLWACAKMENSRRPVRTPPVAFEVK